MSAKKPQHILAKPTWDAFKPYINRMQWCFDTPSHGARSAEITSAIVNKGEKGSHTFVRENDEGEEYKYILRHVGEWV